MKTFELIRNTPTEFTSHIYTVHITEGRCDDLGEAHVRPKHYERDEIDRVEDEDGRDVTEWAIRTIGRERLIEDRSYEI
jgi:hypothetical protein